MRGERTHDTWEYGIDIEIRYTTEFRVHADLLIRTSSSYAEREFSREHQKLHFLHLLVIAHFSDQVDISPSTLLATMFFSATCLFAVATPCSHIPVKPAFTVPSKTRLGSVTTTRVSELDEVCSKFLSEYSSSNHEKALFTLFDIADVLESSKSGHAGLPDEILAVLQESPLAKRIITQPNGHPGDYEMIETIIYGLNRAPIGTFGHELENLLLTTEMAEQHRNKVQHQARLIDGVAEDENAQILSIACGGNADIRSLDQNKLKNNHASLTMVDFDRRALDYSKSQLNGLASQCTFVEANVVKLTNPKSPICALPRDAIVAGGLFDYLPERLIVKLLANLWTNALKPGGALLFTNIGPNYNAENFMKHLLNWHLISRSEQQLRTMCLNAGIPDECMDIFAEETGVTYIVKIQKLAQ